MLWIVTLCNSISNSIVFNCSALSYAPRLSLGPVDTTAMVGGDVTLPCVANAASSYTWTKDSHPVNTTTTPRMNLRNGSLQIKGVSNTDAGGYVCKANIHLSKILQSSPATLSVYGNLKRHYNCQQNFVCTRVVRSSSVCDNVIVKRNVFKRGCHCDGKVYRFR